MSTVYKVPPSPVELVLVLPNVPARKHVVVYGLLSSASALLKSIYVMAYNECMFCMPVQN